MSVSEPPEDPNAWNADDTSAVPVGPEPEPTGAGGSGGAGGWGGDARVEPFAIAALVWAVVSIVIPLIGTIVAFALAARAADLIRRSQGERSGKQYVTAARIVAGGVLAIWIIGLIGFLALRDSDSDNDNVAVPTQPPSTVAAATTTTTTPPVTTTTVPPVTTTVPVPPPTITVVPPPPTTAAPPPTTVTPTTEAPPPTTDAPPPTTDAPPPTTDAPPPTTSPDEGKAAKVQAKLVNRVGESNRGVPDDERFVVTYTPGTDLLVTWAINNGSVGENPTGTPSCTAPPTDPPTTTTEPTTSSTTSTTTTTTLAPATTTTPGAGRTTQEQARYEAKQILASIRPQLTSLKLDVPGVQLVGTYPLQDAGDDTVVQVRYTKDTVLDGIGDYEKAFEVPPAEVVECLDPAFELS